MKLGPKIKDFIKSKFPSIQAFADEIGMKREQLYPYFKDEVIPSASFLAKLREYGCNVNELLDESLGMVKEKRESFGASDKDIIRSQQEEIKQLKLKLEKIEKLLK